MNFAESAQRAMWFAHPLIGDCSFDSFQRYEHNPIHTGIGLWEWPVNGFLFIDPPSGNWYVYVSLYAKGYIPLGTVILMRSTDKGATWSNIGPIFDSRGLAEQYHPAKNDSMGSLDAVVVFDGDTYHLAYGWGSLKEDGGIAYAKSKHPEGPFIMDPHPIKSEYATPLYLGMYKRTYACTLLRRANDWIILTMMSTPLNGGGTWALVALTSEQAAGPYGEPEMLLYPQSKIYHPAPLEFFPSFVHEEYVYAPSTSVGKNRSYQVVFRAKLEECHKADAWELHQEGSVWHSVVKPSEHHGIWGQTISGQVLEIGGEATLLAMYPSLNAEGRGTINIASRPWNRPYEDRFVLSGNNGPAVSFIRADYTAFRLEAKMVSSGAAAIAWGWTAPVGPTVKPKWADAQPHEFMFASCYQLSFTEGAILIRKLSRVGGEGEIIAEQKVEGLPEGPIHVVIEQEDRSCTVQVNGVELTAPLAAVPGRIGLIAETGTILSSDHFRIEGRAEAAWIDLLPTEGLAGPAQDPTSWDLEEGEHYRHGFGYRSTDRIGYGGNPDKVIKWNFRGTAFQMWMPVVGAGKIRAELDGELLGEYTLIPDGDDGSRLILERSGLQARNYALTITLLEGEMRCDCCSIKL